MRQSKWITYAVMAFIAYSVITGHYGEIKSAVKSNVDTIASLKPVTDPAAMEKGTYTEKKITNVMEVFMQTETGKKFMGDVIKKAPGGGQPNASTENMQMLDSLQGSGEPVICGQKATIHYSVALEGGKMIDSTRTANRPLTFELGEGKVIKGLELGIIGMRKGGIRKLTVPSVLAYDNPKFTSTAVPPFSTVLLDVELIDIAPALPNASSTLEFSDIKLGTGKAAECGSNLLLHYTASYSDGRKIVSSKDTNKPLMMRLGSKTAPIGVAQGVMQMKMGGVRTMMIAPALFTTLSGKSSGILPRTIEFRPGDLIKLNVELISVY